VAECVLDARRATLDPQPAHRTPAHIIRPALTPRGWPDLAEPDRQSASKTSTVVDLHVVSAFRQTVVISV